MEQYLTLRTVLFKNGGRCWLGVEASEDIEPVSDEPVGEEMVVGTGVNVGVGCKPGAVVAAEGVMCSRWGLVLWLQLVFGSLLLAEWSLRGKAVPIAEQAYMTINQLR